MNIRSYAETEDIGTMKVNNSVLSTFLPWLRKNDMPKARTSNLKSMHVYAAGRQFSTTVSFWVTQKDLMEY